jgi:cellobiose phosphorylase
VIGETVLGNGDRAFDYYCKIAPGFQDEVELHKLEPYVYAQMIAGKQASRPGEAKNSWLTGTAAWNYHAITEHILGIKPDYDGLRIDPCIPARWSGYTVARKYRGATLKIRVRNPDGVSKGVRSISVNGVAIADNLILISEPGAEYRVDVVMGSAAQVLAS